MSSIGTQSTLFVLRVKNVSASCCVLRTVHGRGIRYRLGARQTSLVHKYPLGVVKLLGLDDTYPLHLKLKTVDNSDVTT